MLDDLRKQTIFDRLVEKGQIENRWSCVLPADDLSHASINGEIFYVPGNFPSTGERMRKYEIQAPVLAQRAVDTLNLGDRKSEITHLIVTSCTGFSAPGIDLSMIPRNQHIGNTPAFIFGRPRILRIFQKRIEERILLGRPVGPQNSGNES